MVKQAGRPVCLVPFGLENSTTAGSFIHFKGEGIAAAIIFRQAEELMGALQSGLERFLVMADQDASRDGQLITMAEMNHELTWLRSPGGSKGDAFFLLAIRLKTEACAICLGNFAGRIQHS